MLGASWTEDIVVNKIEQGTFSAFTELRLDWVKMNKKGN